MSLTRTSVRFSLSAARRPRRSQACLKPPARSPGSGRGQFWITVPCCAAVIDAIDTSFLRRGLTLGLLRLFGHTYLYRTLRIAGRPIVWAQAVRPGVARTFQDEELITEDRFQAGGEYSVRGYETESLRAPGRPQEETAVVLNEELRFPLPFDLTGLFFFDAGQVWQGLGEFEGDLAKSLGLGLRAKTPVGLLRFDLAFPLDRRPENEAYKLYLGFGNAF